MNDNLRKIINIHEGIDFNTETRYSKAMQAFDATVKSLTEQMESSPHNLSEEAEKVKSAHQSFKAAVQNQATELLGSQNFKDANTNLTQSTEIIYSITNRISKAQQRITQIIGKGQNEVSKEDKSEVAAIINSCVRKINDSIPAQGHERIKKSSGERSL